jgi:catechol-2,3-dioxygenase
MAEIEGITHSGICAVDLPESERFYVDMLGAQFSNRSGLHVDKVVRGRSLNSVVVLADYLLALMVPKQGLDVAAPQQLKGENPFRHAFWVSRERFDEVLERFQDHGIAFEGPVDHPAEGPLGQSIYFRDPAGNFLEVCWRRPSQRSRTPMSLSGRLAEH